MGKKKKKPVVPEGIVPIAENRRARYEFSIDDTFECGLVLQGTEVKSLRLKQVEFTDAYAFLQNGEIRITGLKISPYQFGNIHNHESNRTRTLLLHRAEIDRIEKQLREKGKTLVPMKLYFKKGWAKILMGLGKGKREVDRREDIKKRDSDRELRRAMRRGG